MFDKLKRNRGFTMAELLIVVAIIGVLSGVSFIAVQTHHRSMGQLERDAIAKELFVAAQNHLAVAKSENYQGVANFGTAGNADDDAGNGDIYYFYSGSDFSADNSSLLDRMLPFGAIDETVRAGKYIIRYQPKAAVVLDVFYWTTNDSNSKLNCNIGADDYATLMNNYTGENHTKYSAGVLGWFGGEGSVSTGVTLATPDIEVENAERLLVRVKDKNADISGAQIKLIVTGESSHAKAAISLKGYTPGGRIDAFAGQYEITLDDVTKAGMHFAQINNENYQFLKDGEWNIPFIPGENITVQAVSYSNSALASIAYSGEVTTNSLFGEISAKSLDALYAEASHADADADSGLSEEEEDEESAGAGTVYTAAMIGNFRHLENLDAAISHLDENDGKNKLNITSAMQTADLDWTAFLDAFGGSATIYDVAGNAAKADCFVPVNPSHWDETKNENERITPVSLTYDGKGVTTETTTDADSGETTTTYAFVSHSVTGILVNNNYTAADTQPIAIANGGMFGSVAGGVIRNLELIDTSVALTSGNAGALAGTMTGGTVSNVLAINTTDARTTADVTADGSVGGLIGVLVNNGVVDHCAAALTVESKGGSAGGLIGTISNTGAIVSNSYSGGHTVNGSYYNGDTPIINVTGATLAGGLVGDTGSAQKLENCYSTCSVKGATAGGLAGNANVLVSCYATGLVTGIDETSATGALVGELKDSANVSKCLFYEIINDGMPAAGNAPDGVTGIDITAIDASVASYDAFVGKPADWADAAPYDATLKDCYHDADGNALYPLMTVEKLGAKPSSSGGSDGAPGGEGEGTPASGEGEEASAEDAAAYFVAAHYGDWPAPEIFVLNESTD